MIPFASHSSRPRPCALPPSASAQQSNTIYNVLFKRNSVMVPAIFGTAFAFSLSYDTVTSAWWDNHNKGVSTRCGSEEGVGRGR